MVNEREGIAFSYLLWKRSMILCTGWRPQVKLRSKDLRFSETTKKTFSVWHVIVQYLCKNQADGIIYDKALLVRLFIYCTVLKHLNFLFLVKDRKESIFACDSLHSEPKFVIRRTNLSTRNQNVSVYFPLLNFFTCSLCIHVYTPTKEYIGVSFYSIKKRISCWTLPYSSLSTNSMIKEINHTNHTFMHRIWFSPRRLLRSSRLQEIFQEYTSWLMNRTFSCTACNACCSSWEGWIVRWAA
jgi:hypothetical protein